MRIGRPHMTFIRHLLLHSELSKCSLALQKGGKCIFYYTIPQFTITKAQLDQFICIIIASSILEFLLFYARVSESDPHRPPQRTHVYIASFTFLAMCVYVLSQVISGVILQFSIEERIASVAHFKNPLWRNWLARLTVTACSSESGGWKFEPSRRRIIFASRLQSKSGCGERRRSFCQRGSKRPEVSESPLTLTSRKNIE